MLPGDAAQRVLTDGPDPALVYDDGGGPVPATSTPSLTVLETGAVSASDVAVRSSSPQEPAAPAACVLQEAPSLELGSASEPAVSPRMRKGGKRRSNMSRQGEASMPARALDEGDSAFFCGGGLAQERPGAASTAPLPPQSDQEDPRSGESCADPSAARRRLLTATFLSDGRSESKKPPPPPLMPQPQVCAVTVRTAVREAIDELRVMLENIQEEQELLSRKVQEVLKRCSLGAAGAPEAKERRSVEVLQDALAGRQVFQKGPQLRSRSQKFSFGRVADADLALSPRTSSDKKVHIPDDSPQRVMSFENMDSMLMDMCMRDGCGNSNAAPKGQSVTHAARSRAAATAQRTCDSPASALSGVVPSSSDPRRSSPTADGHHGPARVLNAQAIGKRLSWASPDLADRCLETEAPQSKKWCDHDDLAERGHSSLPNSPLDQFSVPDGGCPPDDDMKRPRKDVKGRASLSQVMGSLDCYKTSEEASEFKGCDSGRQRVNRSSTLQVTDADHVEDMDALRQKHEEVIIDEEYIPTGPACSPAYAPTNSWPLGAEEYPSMGLQKMLYIYGVLPYNEGQCAACYGRLVCLVTLGIIAYGVGLVAPRSPRHHPGDAGERGDFRYTSLTDIFFALGCTMSLRSLQQKGIHRLLGRCADRPLETLAVRYGILEEWKRDSRQCFWVVGGILCAEVLLRAALTFTDFGWTEGVAGAGLLEPRGFPVFLFTSGLFSALNYCHLHLCCGLGWLVDQFTWELCRGLDAAKGMRKWGVVQAFLRNAATTMETSFVAIMTSVLLSLLLLGADTVFAYGQQNGERLSLSGRLVSSLLPLVPKLLLSFYSCYRGAQVTERCMKAPALVNMVMTGPSSEHLGKSADGLQNVVQYIAQSDAGFYIFSKRLDMSTVWKWIYIVGLFVFYVMTYSR